MDRTLLALGLIFGILLSPGTLALDITFLDVGEGEAVVLESQGQTALIDAGNPMSGWAVVNFLQKKGLESIDMAIVTHPHPDHFGGIFQLLPYIEIFHRLDNGQDLTSGNDLFRWYTESFRSGNYRALKAGDVLKLGNAELKVLNGFQTSRADLNQNSLVIMVSHGSSKALLMGDAGIPVEESLISQKSDLRADLLKVGHHGDTDATSPAFLGQVMPTIAVISTNCANTRGYPAAKTLTTLKTRGISVLTTCRDGHLSFKSAGSGFSRTP